MTKKKGAAETPQENPDEVQGPSLSEAVRIILATANEPLRVSEVMGRAKAVLGREVPSFGGQVWHALQRYGQKIERGRYVLAPPVAETKEQGGDGSGQETEGGQS